MSFQRVHQFNPQNSRTSSNTPQFAPRQSSAQKPEHFQTREDIENEAFQQNQFEAFGLQLKEKYGTITPVEQEKLGVLQAKMDNFWAQRMERAKAQPSLLESLIHNAQATQTTESQAPVQSNTIQAKSGKTGDCPDSSVEQRPNKTGMPDALKAGVESLSGYFLDDVRVHYHSPKPAQLQTLAYTQGTDIYVAPGQEEHLPHEAWHVVQQIQGRVRPTRQVTDTSTGIRGTVLINDNPGLEREADLMGEKLATQKISNRFPALQGKLVTNEGGLKSLSVINDNNAHESGTFIQLGKGSSLLSGPTLAFALRQREERRPLVSTPYSASPGISLVNPDPQFNVNPHHSIPAQQPVIQGFGLWLAGKYIAWEASRQQAKRQEETSLHKKMQENDLKEQQLNLEYSDPKTDSERRDEIKSSLTQLESERTKLVDKLISGGHRMWLGSQEATNNEENQKLWQNVQSGKSGIRFVDTTANTLRLKANMAKFMQSEHGRNMIKSIDPKSQNIYLTSNAASYTTDQSIKSKQSSWASPIHSVSNYSWSYDFRPNAKAMAKDAAPSQNELVNLDFSDTATDSVAVNDERLHMPSYVTLGHELGHAIGRMTGTASPKNPQDISQDPTDREQQFMELSPGPKEMWGNPEEYRNIQDNENLVRAQLELPKRQYHANYSAVQDYNMVKEMEHLPEKYLEAMQSEIYNLTEVKKDWGEKEYADAKKTIQRKYYKLWKENL